MRPLKRSRKSHEENSRNFGNSENSGEPFADMNPENSGANLNLEFSEANLNPENYGVNLNSENSGANLNPEFSEANLGIPPPSPDFDGFEPGEVEQQSNNVNGDAIRWTVEEIASGTAQILREYEIDFQRWTLVEKRKLGEALRLYGSEDLEKISRLVGRSPSQIRQYIESLKTKASEDFLDYGVDRSNAMEGMKGAEVLDLLDEWMKRCRKNLPDGGREDFSRILSDVLLVAAAQLQIENPTKGLTKIFTSDHQEEIQVDIGKIYKCIAALINGDNPIPLNKGEGEILAGEIIKLCSEVTNYDLTKQKEFLQVVREFEPRGGSESSYRNENENSMIRAAKSLNPLDIPNELLTPKRLSY